MLDMFKKGEWKLYIISLPCELLLAFITLSSSLSLVRAGFEGYWGIFLAETCSATDGMRAFL